MPETELQRHTFFINQKVTVFQGDRPIRTDIIRTITSRGITTLENSRWSPYGEAPKGLCASWRIVPYLPEHGVAIDRARMIKEILAFNHWERALTEELHHVVGLIKRLKKGG